MHPKIGLTFAHCLRSILRHDPDVILIGEMRDMETAENAIQASLTGHLVFSTLHTNDAPSAFTRLDRHGHRAVPGGQHGGRRAGPAAGADDLQGVQGGIRAAPCRHSGRLSRMQGKPPKMWRGKGCRRCHHTGFKGRTGIFELMVTTDDIKEMVSHRVNAHMIRKDGPEGGA